MGHKIVLYILTTCVLLYIYGNIYIYSNIDIVIYIYTYYMIYVYIYHIILYIYILYYIILHTYIRFHRRIPQTSHISLFMLPQLSVAQGRKKHWQELAMRKALAIAPRGQRAMELLNISVPVAEEHVFSDHLRDVAKTNQGISVATWG